MGPGVRFRPPRGPGRPKKAQKRPEYKQTNHVFFFRANFYFFGPPWAPGWPETDSPRKMMANSGVDTRIRALGTRFVAIFRLYVKAKNMKNAIELLTGFVSH